MNKRRESQGVVKCPNMCGKEFRLYHTGEPKQMIKHLSECGDMNVFSDVLISKLRAFKERIGG